MFLFQHKNKLMYFLSLFKKREKAKEYENISFNTNNQFILVYINEF